LERAGHIVLGLEVTRPYPTHVAQAALIGTDVQTMAVLDIHRNDAFGIVQLTQLNEQRLVEMPGDEQTARAVDQLDVVLGVVAQLSAQRGDELSVSQETVD